MVYGNFALWLKHLLYNNCFSFHPFPQIFASGAFELKLNSFRNQFGLNSDNNCCSGVKDHSGYCTESCRTFFKICLKEYQTHIVTDSPKCTFGSVTTPVVGANTFNIQDSSSSSSSNTQDQLLENPIKLHFEFSWPVSIYEYKLNALCFNRNKIIAHSCIYTIIRMMANTCYL